MALRSAFWATSRALVSSSTTPKPILRTLPIARFSSEVSAHQHEPAVEDSVEEADVTPVEEKPPLSAEALAYDRTKPPHLPAFNPKSIAWERLAIYDQGKTNWPNEDPNDWSRTSFDEEFKEIKRLDMRYITDEAKTKMWQLHKSNEVEWSPEKLASTYQIKQPRVEAILLLKEWENEQRDLGLLTKEDEAREALFEKAHIQFVRDMEEEYDVHLSTKHFADTVPINPAEGAPMGKFMFLKDSDVHKKPDMWKYIKEKEAAHIADQEMREEQPKSHRRLKNKRWTFVIKDTTQPNVKY